MLRVHVLPLACFAAMALVCGCGVSEDDTDDSGYVPGDHTAVTCPPDADGVRYIAFGGRCWTVRQSNGLEGPGLNYYSADGRDVWVDEQGRLHLKISYRDGKWLCSEVVSSGVGYGRYIFYTSGDMTLRDGNVVLGFFTWDNTARDLGYMSELDIELTRWGRVVNRDIHYSVQPLYGPDTADHTYPERSESHSVQTGHLKTTHVLNWSAEKVAFASYDGWSTSEDNLLSEWEFSSSKPARRAEEEGMSTPTVIPAPTDGTLIIINLWLYDALWNDDIGDAPLDGTEVEVVVDGFQYNPS